MTLRVWPCSAILLLVCAGCRLEPGEDGHRHTTLSLDGSSTVFPVSQAVAEEYVATHRGARIAVGVSGTYGGFRRLCAGRAILGGASRQIRSDERLRCAENGIVPLEIQIGWDGLTLVTHPSNDWARCLTVEELRLIWAGNSAVGRWNDVRPDWPDRELKLYGPDTDSGTFDYFTTAIIGTEGASRGDYTASADDNMLVLGVGGDPGALGYLGYAYAGETGSRLQRVAVDGGSGCVDPTPSTIADRSYALSRPIFIYVARGALTDPETLTFVRFYLDQAADLIREAGYVPLAPAEYAAAKSLLQ